ncbi:chemotaxis protein [Rhizobium sp. TRM95111]|uniref:chemotaxis protein n=1 Tax=Rhizobium alarense TaxID=2846851 RepID=UPI001F1D034E|nr:chemotaxis protein [Rhizobium alarense]MCF3638627.1 chemotaxis protein [Rhizobium alarense]
MTVGTGTSYRTINTEETLADRLEGARSRIEQRFLDGGAVLLSVLDVLNRLVASLERLSGSLDEDAARDTIERLAETVRQISALPAVETNRQTRLVAISATGQTLAGHVAAMQETLRYLRTFATTAKIAGAGIPDFAGFAEEIIERIQFGTGEVNALSARITGLGTTIGVAAGRGGQTLARYETSVPPIVASLTRNADELTRERRQFSDLAEKVAQMARKVQMKVATTLSALQIGDITRQRIEHCQSAFALTDTFFTGPDGSAVGAADRARISLLVDHLVYAQLTETSRHFERECTTVVATIRGFANDIGQLLDLYGTMAPAGDAPSGDSGLRRLEADIAAARHVVGGIEQAAEDANRLSRETTATVRELLQGVETIKLVRTDIQYMALNTNLRCSKLGEDGRAINVVTAELRTFSAMLDDTAEKILEALKVLDVDAGALGEATASGELSLDGRLEDALATVHAAGDRMEADLADLHASGGDVAAKVAGAVATLDFKAELGDVLADCAALARPATAAAPDGRGIEEALAVLGPRIAATYTMMSEREIHGRLFGVDLAAAAPAPAAAQSDEDLFEDALF